jgi:hypothetical protein
MKEIRTEILIKASPKKVWGCFSAFEHYAEWNPFMHTIQGNISVGDHIKIELTPPDARPMTIGPKVLKVEQDRELRWIGHLLIPGLFDGEHIFELIDNKDGTTTFVQREEFNGILVPFFRKLLDDNTKRGFESMNLSLKEKCESGTEVTPAQPVTPLR